METTNQMSKVYQYINLDYLDMMADGDNDMKKIMLGMLFEEMPLEIEKMQQLCEAKEWDELSSVSHKMKSTLSFVGNEEMTNANQALEIMAKAADEPEALPPLVNTLAEMWPKVKPELQTVHDSL